MLGEGEPRHRLGLSAVGGLSSTTGCWGRGLETLLWEAPLLIPPLLPGLRLHRLRGRAAAGLHSHRRAGKDARGCRGKGCLLLCQRSGGHSPGDVSSVTQAATGGCVEGRYSSPAVLPPPSPSLEVLPGVSQFY